MEKLRCTAAIAILLLACAHGWAQPAKPARVALVIGNGAYLHAAAQRKALIARLYTPLKCAPGRSRLVFRVPNAKEGRP